MTELLRRDGPCILHHRGPFGGTSDKLAGVIVDLRGQHATTPR